MAVFKRLANQLPARARSRLKAFYYHHPWLRRLAYGPVDALDWVTGHRDPLVPPRSLRIIGDGDFREMGATYLKLFIELGGLVPGERILEVGCGLGRMAVALAEAGCGPYQGFDIVPGSIKWAKRHVGRRFPEFHFDLVDVENRLYNPQGGVRGELFTFPYDDHRFDFVIATSVFTHLIPQDTQRYLQEIRRVMTPQARCFATFFVLQQGANFEHAFGADEYGSPDLHLPESAIVYEEERLAEWFDQAGLELVRPLVPGYQAIAILAPAGVREARLKTSSTVLG